jgi:DNA-binding winged helix-turn-helix (wHTH) protein/tetratricopeptide (TPR) repeat protein
VLKLSDLAQRPDFELGPLQISPARRLVAGPAGETHVEPLVMQVFLLLIDVGGQVVTRQALFDQVWGGVAVGDDSLNRAIAGVRRIAAEAAPGSFEIETIPRTGYRVVGEILQHQDKQGAGSQPGRVSRRELAGGAVATAAIGVAGWWWFGRDRTDPRVEKLIAEGDRLLRAGPPDGRLQAMGAFRKAIALDPDNAKAWGLLAYAESGALETASGRGGAQTALSADRSAKTALSIDPNEPNARLAMLKIQNDMIDWIAREDGYREILEIDPSHFRTMHLLAQLLHGVGRCRDSYVMGERANALEPMWPDLQMRRAIRLWVLGRVAEADRVSDRAMQLWPTHRLVRMARLFIYAFTGRTRAALAMIEEEEAAPKLLSRAAAHVWRVSLTAMEQPTPSTIAAARDANVEGSKTTPATAAWAILILSALGELDAAFDVANGFLLARGSVIVRPKLPAKGTTVNNPGWRNSFGLFTPPTKAMRLDPRFGPLCDGLGLTEYWRRRGIGPDAFLFKA